MTANNINWNGGLLREKKNLILLLSFALCLTLLPTAALVADSTDTWDGTADISWYTDHEADTEYRITTAEQLAGWRSWSMLTPELQILQEKLSIWKMTLILSGHEWISIGTVLGGDNPGYSFCGVFDGQGHVISNLYSRIIH